MVLMVMVIALMVMVIALMVMVIALMGNGNSANANTNTKSYLMVVSAKYWWCSLSSSVVFD